MSQASSDDLKGQAHAEPGNVELTQDVPEYNWDSMSGCGCCGCFNFVLQLVLIGALGSFMFGFNIALLNTATDAVFSAFQQCGIVSDEYRPFAKFSLQECEAVKLCKDNCINKEAVQCPGGYNDLGCDDLKWFRSILSCAILIGAAIGCMSGSRFLSFGRRLVLLCTNAIFFMGVISSVVSNSFSALLWARLIVGYAVGLISVASPTYMAEMTPASKRGTYGVFHQLFIVIGIFVAMLLGLALESPVNQNDTWVPSTFQQFWWRFMLALGMLPVITAVCLLTYAYSFETPHYYVEQRRFEDARRLLQRIHGRQDVSEELNSIIQHVRESEISKANGLTFGRAFQDPIYRKVIIIGCLLSAFQQLGGVNVFMTSSNDLFAKAGLSGSMQTAMSITMGGLNVLMTFPTLYLIEKMGRKSLLFTGSLLQFLFVVPAAIMYWTEKDPLNPSQTTSILAIMGVLGFVASFALAYGPVLWVYLFEIYPMEIKETAAGVATAANWVSGILMVFLSVVLPNQISFTLFACFQLVGTLIIFFFMRETKGRQLGDSPFMVDAAKSHLGA